MLSPVSSPKRPEHDATEEDDREAIVARRNRFVKAALLGLAGATLAAACSDSAVTGDGGADASADTTTTPTSTGTTPPQPCLSIAIDADAPDANEAGPQPCLVPPLDAGGD